MNAHVEKFLRLPLLAGGIAAILVSVIAVAALAILASGAGGDFATVGAAQAAGPPAIDAAADAAHRCAECGVIVSTREIKGPDERSEMDAPGPKGAGSRGGAPAASLRAYEITIRLHDGTMRVIRDAKPAKWRHGEAVIVIAGAD